MTACDTARDAVEAADIVICVVTADQAAHAASLAARHLRANALWLDMNSCAPGTKQMASGPVARPVRHMSMLRSWHRSPRADMKLRCWLQPRIRNGRGSPQAAGLAPRFVGTEIGRASTIKMLRSVMVKGMEALTVECFRAAARAGVAEEVANSLDASEGGLGWADQTAYNMERMTAHGIRRAAEMREVAKTLRGLDVAPAMTTGTISWEEEMGALGLSLDPAHRLPNS